MQKAYRKKGGNARGSGRLTKLRDRDRIPDMLPQIEDQLCVGKTLRFVTTGAGGSTSASVSYANLLDAWLVAGSATTAYQLFDFVKVKRVTVRAIPYNGSFEQSVTVGIEYPGLVAGSIGAGNQASNTGLGTAKPVVVSLKPGPLSQSAQWQPSSNQNAFVVRATNQDNTVALGAIIDVELAYKNSADVSPAAIASAASGMTAGNLYYGGIDGGRLAATWARSVFIPRI